MLMLILSAYVTLGKPYERLLMLHRFRCTDSKACIMSTLGSSAHAPGLTAPNWCSGHGREAEAAAGGAEADDDPVSPKSGRSAKHKAHKRKK